MNMQATHTTTMPSDQTPVLTRRMKGIAHTAFGDSATLVLGEVDRPAVGAGEVLIQVKVAAVNKGDWHVMTGLPYLIRLAGYGVTTPKHAVLGQEIAGVVAEVGRDVTEFSVGDEVFGEVPHGGFAEYVCASVDRIAHKPATLPFEAAAALPTALTALKALRDVADLQPGQHVLLNGASGGVGTFAIQLAKHFGAVVTAVCSGRNAAFVRELGADHVIDYTKEDFVAAEHRYDLVLDLVGNRTLAECRRVLKREGMYISSAGQGGDWFGPMGRMFGALLTNMVVPQTMTFLSPPDASALAFLAQLHAEGVLCPAIGKRCTLAEVPEALAHQGSGRTRGKTIVTL